MERKRRGRGKGREGEGVRDGKKGERGEEERIREWMLSSN